MLWFKKAEYYNLIVFLYRFAVDLSLNRILLSQNAPYITNTADGPVGKGAPEPTEHLSLSLLTF